MKKIIPILFTLLSSTALYSQPNKTKVSIERGKVVYEEHCLVCHQADGSGVQSLNPPLIKTKWVLGDKKALIHILLRGLDEEIEVDGESYHNVMPPVEYLSDQEIADVLSFVRNNFTNKASMVGAEEVKTVRSLSK